MTPFPLWTLPPSPMAKDLLWACSPGACKWQSTDESSPFSGTQSLLMAPFYAGKVISHRAGPLQFWWSPLYSKHLYKEARTLHGSVHSMSWSFLQDLCWWVSAKWASHPTAQDRNSWERRRKTRNQTERSCHSAYLCKPEWRLAFPHLTQWTSNRTEAKLCFRKVRADC